MAQRFVTEFVIDGDASGGVRAFNDTQRSADQLNRSMETGTQRTAEYTRGIGSASQELQVLRRVAAPVTALVAGMFTAQTLKGQIDFADQVQKINLRIGASTEFLSEMNYVAELSGVKFTELATALQRQTRRMSEAANGGGPMLKTLQALNLNAAELVQLAPEQQFDRIAQALNGVANENDRVAMAQKIWDSEGVKLLQIVNQGTDAISQQREQARALGLTISNETANAMAGFNDQMTILQFSAQGLAQTLLAEIVPGLSSTMQATNELIQDLGGAEVVVAAIKDGAILLSGVLAGRLAGSLLASGVAMKQKMAADRAAALQSAAVAQQERDTALATARRSEADRVAALNSARITQQRAQAAQVEAAARMREITTTQELMAAERVLETQRLQAQISATGRQQSLARLAEIRRQEIALVGQATAAQKALQAAELQAANSTRALTAAKVDATRAAKASDAALAASTATTLRATNAQTAFAGAARASRLAMAPLGGPLGVAVLAASAFMMFRDSSDEVKTSLDNLDQPLNQVIEQFKEMNEAAQQAALIRWGDRAEEEAAKAEEAIKKIRREMANNLTGRSLWGGLDEVQYDGYRRLLAEVNEVADGARNLTEVLNEAQEYMVIPDDVMRRLRLLAEEYADHGDNSREATETLASLREALNDVATAADNAGDSVNDGAPGEAAISKWEKYNDQLRETIANLRDPSLLGRTNRALDGMGIFDPARRATTLMLEMERERLEQQKKANAEAASAARQRATAVQREAQRITQAYENQAAKLREEIALFGETGDAAKLRYELEHGALKDLAPEQKEHLQQLREELDLKEKQAKAAEDFKKKTDDLVSTYDRQSQQAKKLRADLEAINAAYRDPAVDMSREQYTRMIAEIEQQQYQLSLESETTFAAMATAWENSVQRMDDAGVQFWRGFLDGTGNALDQFKRLVLDSVAEVAHALITKPLVVGLATDLGGAFGFAPGGRAGGGLNFANTLSAGRNLWSTAGSLFGGGASTAAGYGATGWAGSATGAYGGWAGSAAAGAAQAGGGFMGAASAAMPWIGAGLLADNVLGLGITDGIVKGIGKLFGGGKSTPRLNVSTYGDRSAFSHDSVAESALGVVGFGKGTKRSNDLFGGIDQERQWLASVAAMDDMLASVADSPEQLEAMRRAVQSVHISAGDAAGANARLVDRTTAVAAVIDGYFAGSLRKAGLNAEEMTARVVSAAQAMQLIDAASDRLNLNYRKSGHVAMHWADLMAQQAGGLDNLAALQDSYYQQFFSEAERAANLQNDLTRSLNAMGMALPENEAGFRRLIEAQRLHTDAGARNYVQLLQLASGFSELQQMLGKTEGAAGTLRSAADIAQEAAGLNRQYLQLTGNTLELRRLELEALDPSNRALQERNWLIEDEQAAQEAAKRAQEERIRQIERESQAWARARDQLANFGNGIGNWLAQFDATQAGMGTPRSRLEASDADFWAQYQKALGGDRNAQGSITQYADRYIANLQEMYASGAAGQAGIAEIRDALARLPEMLSPEQFLADEFAGIIAEQTGVLAGRVDLNGDGTVSALERAIAEDWNATQLLSSVLNTEMNRLGTTVLTEAQIRRALAPHATDAEIDRLIREVDTNGDGMINRQELTNARLAGLEGGFARAIATEFDRIDIDASGLIDYNEFRRAFSGMATDAELKRIFSKLDKDGSGTISRLEAINASNSTISHLTGRVDGNTGRMDQQARNTQTGMRVTFAHGQPAAVLRQMAWVGGEQMFEWSSRIGERHAIQMRRQGIGNSGRPYWEGGYTGPGGKFQPAGTVHAGEIVWSQDDIARAGGVDVVEAMRTGRAMANSLALQVPTGPMQLPAPDLPPPTFPLLNQQDTSQAWRDLLDENKQLRRDVTRLLERIEQQGAASVAVQQDGFKQQINEQRRGNVALEDMSTAARLEESRR